MNRPSGLNRQNTKWATFLLLDGIPTAVIPLMGKHWLRQRRAKRADCETRTVAVTNSGGSQAECRCCEASLGVCACAFGCVFWTFTALVTAFINSVWTHAHTWLKHSCLHYTMCLFPLQHTVHHYTTFIKKKKKLSGSSHCRYCFVKRDRPGIPPVCVMAERHSAVKG